MANSLSNPLMAVPALGRPSLRQFARPPAARRGWWPFIAAFMAVGYLTTSRTFAYLGLPALKLFIGEIALAVFLLTRPRAILDVWLNAIRKPGRLRAFSVLLAVFVAYGAAELVRGVALGYPLLNAAHDFSFQYYGLYFFIGLYVGVRRPETLRTVALWVGWVNGIYGIAFVALLSRSIVPVIQNAGSGVNPGSDVNLFGQPFGSAIGIFGLICFERRWQRIALPVLLNAVVMLAMDIRSEWLGFVVAALVFSILSRQVTKLMVGAGAIVLLLAISYALDIRIPKPATRGGGTTSARDIVGRIIAPIDPSAAAEYSDGVRVASATATWRSDWWKAIWESVRDDEKLLVFGHGYGYPLTDVVPYLQGRHYIRTPHSYVFFALGYGGVLMLALLVAVQVALLRLLYLAFRTTGQAFGLVAATILLTWGLFDSSFESPYRAAPFFIITGIAIAPVMSRAARSAWAFNWSGAAARFGAGGCFEPPSAGARLFLVICAALCPLASASAQVSFTPQSAGIAETVKRSPAGTTFTFSPGVYRNLQILPNDDQVFLAQRGVVFNGSIQITSFGRHAPFWVIANQSPVGQPRGECKLTHPRCVYPQDLFIDDQPLRHVASREAVVSGTWFYDFPTSTIYFVDNPVNRKVELSVARVAFTGPAVNVTIDGFVIEKYANEAQLGAIGEESQGAGWLIRNNEVRLNHGVGITVASFGKVSNNYIHHNGNLGILTAETTVLRVRKAVIEKNEVAFNNWAGFDPGWAAGGVKVCSAVDLIVRDNWVHDNIGHGIWADIDSANVLYEGNVVTNNRGSGLVHEISFGAVIRRNSLSGNGLADPLWYWGAQILIQNSQGVEVYENSAEVFAGGHGIIIVQQDRGPKYPAKDNWVHHNTVLYHGPGGQSGIASDFDAQNALANQKNVFDYNDYLVRDLSTTHWVWNHPMTKSQFEAVGQERNGVVKLWERGRSFRRIRLQPRRRRTVKAAHGV